MSKPEITISMLEALKYATEHNDGHCGGDNGTRKSLVRRGLAKLHPLNRRIAIITPTGRELVATKYDELKKTLPETRQMYLA